NLVTGMQDRQRSAAQYAAAVRTRSQLTDADSDDVAHLYRHDVAWDSGLMSPGCEPGLAGGFLAPLVVRGQSSFRFYFGVSGVAVVMWTTPLRVVHMSTAEARLMTSGLPERGCGAGFLPRVQGGWRCGPGDRGWRRRRSDRR